MQNIERHLDSAFNVISEAFNEMNNEDKSLFILHTTAILRHELNIEVVDKTNFPGLKELIIEGKKSHWKSCYLMIRINCYESKECKKVYNRLVTFSRKHHFDVHEIDVGQDNPDSNVEISLGLSNMWHEYKLIFNNYIDINTVYEFLEQFPEITINK